jgi:hypothetical protein
MAKAAGARVASGSFIRTAAHRVVLEGGSIDVNGCGTLLTTEECLLSTTQQRNPPMDRAAYEQLFADYFGAQSVIWLDSGIAGDDTHGHVDDITRFVAPNTVVTMVEQNEQSENYAPLCEPGAPEGRAHLGVPTDRNSRSSRFLCRVRSSSKAGSCPPATPIFILRMAWCWYRSSTIRTIASRLTRLAEVFPTREIAPIYCGDLIWGFGALHCMTQQQTRLTPLPTTGSGSQRPGNTMRACAGNSPKCGRFRCWENRSRAGRFFLPMHLTLRKPHCGPATLFSQPILESEKCRHRGGPRVRAAKSRPKSRHAPRRAAGPARLPTREDRRRPPGPLLTGSGLPNSSGSRSLGLPKTHRAILTLVTGPNCGSAARESEVKDQQCWQQCPNRLLPGWSPGSSR